MKLIKTRIETHKFVSIILTLFIICSAVTLSACKKEHEHIFKTEWTSNASEHYHECEGDDCKEVSDKAAHVYDHACDTTCNVCGATREISYYTISPDDDTYNFLGDENIIGVAGGQYVFKLPTENDLDEGRFFMFKDRAKNASVDDQVSYHKYSIRFFNDQFKEIPLTIKSVDDEWTSGYYVGDDETTNNLVNEYRGKVVYMMVTLNEAVTFCPAFI